MNPLIQGKSGTTPVMSRHASSTNQGTNEDDSQSDPHPEAGIFGNQTMRNSGQKIAVTTGPHYFLWDHTFEQACSKPRF